MGCGQSDMSAGKRVRRTIGRVWTILLISLCVALLFILGRILFGRLIMGERVPSVFGYSLLRVSSGSMSDSINEGDIIVVRSADKYECGDVITFFSRGDAYSTTHRIIEVTDGGEFVTRGDANSTTDSELVAPDTVVGRVELVIGRQGVFIFILALVALAVAILLLRRNTTAKHKKKQ